MDILAIIIAFVLGLALGIKAADHFHRTMIKKILEDLGINSEQLKAMEQRIMEDLKQSNPEAFNELEKERDSASPTIQVKLEQHQGILFAYRADTEEFVGQGTDKQTLIDSMAHRFKGVRVEILNGELLQKNNA